jgi:hypothetical protein
MEINEETPLEDLLKNPKATAVLAKHGLPCLFCPAISFEMGLLKLGQVAKVYGLDAKALIKELNEVLREPEPRPQP